VSKLKNIGAKTTAWLYAIGIETEDDIRALGSVEVYRRLKARFPDRVSLNALWGLEAMLLGIKWRDLTADMKEELMRELESKHGSDE
jgi:DNA transformation protein and related proteins